MLTITPWDHTFPPLKQLYKNTIYFGVFVVIASSIPITENTSFCT